MIFHMLHSASKCRASHQSHEGKPLFALAVQHTRPQRLYRTVHVFFTPKNYGFTNCARRARGPARAAARAARGRYRIAAARAVCPPATLRLGRAAGPRPS